jgi:hypothetical protein
MFKPSNHDITPSATTTVDTQNPPTDTPGNDPLSKPPDKDSPATRRGTRQGNA